MNILYLYPSMNPLNGGIERVTSILYHFFNSSGHNAYCIGMRQKHRSEEEEMIYLPNELEENSRENINFLNEFIIKKNINVVIAQITGPNETSRLLMSLSYNTNFRKVACLHLDILDSKRHMGSYKLSTLKRYRIGWIANFLDSRIMGNIFTHLYALLKRYSYRELSQKCDNVILLSDSFIKDYEFISGSRYVNNVSAIPNPMPHFQAEYNFEKKKKTVLYVGRINTSQKKVDYLLQIWNKVYPIHPDWNLKIVGGGDELQQLKDMAISMGLKQYSFEGFQDPASYYKESSIFCMTSSFEGFGMVLVEAMKYGVVPMAFNSYRSVYDIIEDGYNGVLVNSFDIDEYATKLNYLISNVSKRKELSLASLKCAERFDVAAIANQWIDLFSE